MSDLERRHNQTQDTADNYRREVTELRRGLADLTKERDTVSQSNSQLREALRSAETDRIRYDYLLAAVVWTHVSDRRVCRRWLFTAYLTLSDNQGFLC